jgi:hypothetical protein
VGGEATDTRAKQEGRTVAIEVESPWFTVGEAARYAKVGEDLIARWIGEGRIHPSVTRNKKNLKGRGAAGYLIERADLDKFLRTLKVNVAAAAVGGAAAAPEEKPRRPPRPAQGDRSWRDRLKDEGI